jgi:hypothetical protein|tara:strand:+ start:904 stop:1434 length:531 start_codon:yes stop_codon:yes gene_type:complete
MRQIVKLTDEEIDKVKELARGRDAKKKYFGAGRHWACSSKAGSSEASHYYGLLGEMAVAKYFDVALDERIFEKHGDEGMDLQITELGGKVDVKTTIDYVDDPFLRVPMGHPRDVEKLNAADAFVCCCLERKKPNIVQIVGWQTKDKVCQAKTKQLMRNGPINFILRESELEQVPAK